MLEANVERNLKPKVELIREHLGLELEDGFIGAERRGSGEEVAIPIPTTLEARTMTTTKEVQQLSNAEKQRLLAQMIATNPDILTLSIEKNLLPKIQYLNTVLGLDTDQLRYILLKWPLLLALSLERNIVPKISRFTAPRDEEKGGGLGMSTEQVREWLVKYTETVAYPLDLRIIPRIRDIVERGILVGVATGDDNEDYCWGDEEMARVAPGNFVTRSERSWIKWLASHYSCTS
jgi:hypothetical protein